MNPDKSKPNPQISVLQAQISHHSTPNQSINSIYEIQKSIFQFLGHNYVQQRTQKSNINNTFFKQIPPLIPLSLSLSLSMRVCFKWTLRPMWLWQRWDSLRRERSRSSASEELIWMLLSTRIPMNTLSFRRIYETVKKSNGSDLYCFKGVWNASLWPSSRSFTGP